MEALILIPVLIVIAIPILAIVALVKATDTQQKIKALEERVNVLSNILADTAREKPPKIPVPQPEQVTPAHIEKPVVKPEKSTPKPIAAKPTMVPPKPVPKPRPKINMEEAFGGKIAGLIGVMILVAGIAFLVGSPGIVWPEPLFKILMGLTFGGILLAAGHVANRMASGKFVQLSRTMTGGGGGLFYFCIFAAYNMYHLCGPLVTAVGLTLSAALLLFLSLVYNSQIVATLGVLGAFITPLLTGGDVDQGVFPLAYIALINLPVMFLGIKKNWQVLYNSAYAFTLFYFYFWLVNFSPEGWLTALSASVVFFAEFMALSLLIVQQRKRQEAGPLNKVRLAASILFLFINFYFIFEGTVRDAWIGGCFAGTTLVLAGLARLCWKWQAAFKAETLLLILWAILSGALLIFETTSGSIRGLLWCAQALAIAWFFRKPAPRAIVTCSIILSSIGMGTLIWFMFTDTSMDSRWFNLESFLLLAGIFFQSISCWILPNKQYKEASVFLQVSCLAAILLAAGNDILKFSSTDTIPWLIATCTFTGAALFCRKRQTEFIKETLHFTLATLLCFAVFLHMLLAGLWISLSWTVLGTVIALFTLRVNSKELQNSAILIGFAALVHATIQPVQAGANLILINPHTLTGLFTAATIGFQATLYNRIKQPGTSKDGARILWFICIGAVLAISFRNLFTVLPSNTPLPWLLTSIIALFVGNLVSWILGTDPMLRRAGQFIVAAVPVKIILLDVGIPWETLSITPSLTSYILWIQLAMLSEILLFACRTKIEPAIYRGYYAIAPLVVFIALVSFAIGTSDITWSWAVVSLWWGIAGLAFTLFGFARKSKLHRLFALLLFAATIGKVLIVDCSVFQTGARVMILIGIGLLLLILSFIYQKVSAKIL
ncbi:DUF2339 domain-containing protein [Pontiellaceae bacterium B1224]|nr:DUF2339 domain-containing protein [Pontiellaceae bacterium B1224]